MKKILLFFGIVLITAIFFIGYNQARADIYGSTLQAWYKLDSNDISGTSVKDNSNNGFTGTTVGSPVATTGKIGQALLFNATSNYIDLGTASRSMLNGDIGFAVSFWAKSTSTAREAVFGTYNGAGSNYWSIDFNRGAVSPTTNNLRPVYRDATGKELSKYMSSTNAAITDGNWHHYAVNWGISSTINVDIDGVPQTMTNDVLGSPSSPAGFTNNIWIGELNNVGSETSIGYKGPLDDFRIYNFVLTQADMRSLYLQGLAKHYRTF